MLAQAKRKAQQQSLEIRWVQADGRNFKLGQHYANPQIFFLAEDPQRRYERTRYNDPQGNGEVIIEETREYIAARQIVRSTRYYHVGSERNK